MPNGTKGFLLLQEQATTLHNDKGIYLVLFTISQVVL